MEYLWDLNKLNFAKINLDKGRFNKLNKIELLEEIRFKNKLQKLRNWHDEDIFAIRRNQANVTNIEFVPGTQEGLARFIGQEPQYDQLARLRYLLTSGVAVEVITGVQRFHHDTDLVIFDYCDGWWKKYATDNVVAKRYWANMKFDPAFLEETAWKASFEVGGQEQTVLTVHPAIILTQKLSDAWGRTPRVRDLEDVMVLTRFWLEQDKGSHRWADIIEVAISALPEAEQPKTRERITPYLEEARKWREGNNLYRQIRRQSAKLLGTNFIPYPLVQACKP